MWGGITLLVIITLLTDHGKNMILIQEYDGIYWSKAKNEAVFMGACNLRRSLFPLHIKVDALVWAMRSLIAEKNTKIVSSRNALM